jgi:hypothetical protein
MRRCLTASRNQCWRYVLRNTAAWRRKQGSSQTPRRDSMAELATSVRLFYDCRLWLRLHSAEPDRAIAQGSEDSLRT